MPQTRTPENFQKKTKHLNIRYSPSLPPSLPACLRTGSCDKSKDESTARLESHSAHLPSLCYGRLCDLRSLCQHLAVSLGSVMERGRAWRAGRAGPWPNSPLPISSWNQACTSILPLLVTDDTNTHPPTHTHFVLHCNTHYIENVCVANHVHNCFSYGKNKDGMCAEFAYLCV